MDNTAIQPGAPAAKAPETAFQATPPPADAKPTGPTKHPTYVLLERLASLRITVVLFVLSLLLVFWGTLAQVDNGVWTVVAKYFRCFFVWVPIRQVLFNAIDKNSLAIPYPGGLLLGSLMLINLLAAHAIRFKFAWNRAGIILIHAGIIVMMLSEVVTHLYADEASMIIPLGRAINYLVFTRETELAVIKHVNDQKDEVVVIPATKLKPGAKIQDARLPFEIDVLEYWTNSKLFDAAPDKKLATKGLGVRDKVEQAPEVSGVDPNQTHDVPSSFIRLTTRKGEDLGVWLFSVFYSETHLGYVQEVTVDKTTYEVVLRYKQKERPFSLHLTHFNHEFFPGTDTPKDYRSFIHLVDKSRGDDRHVEIYMNAPMSHAGETFYQSSLNSDPQTGKPTGTVLQVVHNPGWAMPYISCGIVGIGLLMHFGLTLYKFIDRRKVR